MYKHIMLSRSLKTIFLPAARCGSGGGIYETFFRKNNSCCTCKYFYLPHDAAKYMAIHWTDPTHLGRCMRFGQPAKNMRDDPKRCGPNGAFYEES